MEAEQTMHIAPKSTNELECGQMSNVMVIGHPAEHRWRPLFNAAKFG